MPKGKAKQRQAGAASTPAFTPSDESAHAKYQQLKSIFTRAFQQAGVTPSRDLWRLWGEICSFDGSSRSKTSLGILLMSLDQQHNSASGAAPLVSLFVRRTLIISGVHQPIFRALVSEHIQDAQRCLVLMLPILGAFFDSNDTTGVPDECLPEPSESYAALARLHWHPRGIRLACRQLLASDCPDDGGVMARYIESLGDPWRVEPDYAQAIGAPRVDFDAVLQDQGCMSAIWRVLQQPSRMKYALHVLKHLVMRVEPFLPLASLSHLLSMGAARPLTSALNHLSAAVLQQRSPCLSVRIQLCQLMCVVSWAAGHDENAGLHTKGASGTVAWPSDLLESYLPVLIKISTTPELYMEEGQIVAPPISFRDLRFFPRASMPTAARVLSCNPISTLSALLDFAFKYLVTPPVASAQRAEACRIVIQFLAGVLVADAEEGILIQQQPPEKLATCAIKAILLAISEEQPELQQTRSPGFSSDGLISSSRADLLQAAATVLLLVSKLTGVEHVLGLIKALDESPELAARVHALKASLSGGLGTTNWEALVSMIDTAHRSCMDAGVPGSATAAIASGSVDTEGSNSRAKHSGTGKPDRVCASCGGTGKLKKCARCEAVWFCGVGCQRRAWPSHRLVCAPKGAAVP